MFCLALSLFVLEGFGQTCIWKIEKDGKKFFIGGTCHYLNPTDNPIPASFMRAYNQADAVVFESNLDTMGSDNYQLNVIRMSVHMDGTTMKNHLSPSVYQKLLAICKSNNLDLSKFGPYKLSTVILVLYAKEYRKAGIESIESVDAYFNKLAKKDKKPRKELQDPEALMKSSSKISDGVENEFALYSFEEMQEPKVKLEKTLRAWKVGDEKKLIECLLGSMLAKYPHLYKKMIVDRNTNWMPTIERLAQTAEKELILVGSSHLVGQDSVLNMLKKRGYTVRPYTGK